MKLLSFMVVINREIGFDGVKLSNYRLSGKCIFLCCSRSLKADLYLVYNDILDG